MKTLNPFIPSFEDLIKKLIERMRLSPNTKRSTQSP
jgi:hypothetical protein